MPSISKTTEKTFYALGLARISLGFIFLWAFLDKLLGLGFATCRDAASGVVSLACDKSWAAGASPTSGYLEHATKGPFAEIYQGLAGQTWVDWLFMAGLLTAGIGLVLGIMIRLSVIAGSVLMLLMWSSALWPENNPLIDDHIVYLLLLAAIYYGNAQQKWGLRGWWIKQPFVRHSKLLE